MAQPGLSGGHRVFSSTASPGDVLQQHIEGDLTTAGTVQSLGPLSRNRILVPQGYLEPQEDGSWCEHSATSCDPVPGRAGPAAGSQLKSSGSPGGSPAAVDVIDLIVLVEGDGLHAVREGPVQHSDACRTEDKEPDQHGSNELHKLQINSWLEAAPLCSLCKASPALEGWGPKQHQVPPGSRANPPVPCAVGTP